MTPLDTLVAVSTPPGNGAVGILRLSGSNSLSILDKVWGGRIPVEKFEPRRIYTGKINKFGSSEMIDQALVFWMKSPSSYTGEDLVEVQGHGGQRVMELLLANFVTAGARMAGPGEFTKRAFLNGRIDLAQAEAVADLIQATSSQAIFLASRQLEGRLSETVGRLRNDLKVMRAQMEAMIDFPEDEDVQGLHTDEIIDRVKNVSARIQKLVNSYEEGRLLKEGLRVAIVGKPNAGKSSLFNALLQEDRAIVHSTPGTTRDLIEETLDLQGLTVRFIDTAGIRVGGETVESEGIRRTRGRLQQSDLVLVVLDSSRPLDKQDEMVFEAVRGKIAFYLYNKVDLLPSFSVAHLRDKLGATPIFPLSATCGTGVDSLKKEIFSHFVKSGVEEGSNVVLTNLRHRTALQKGLEALDLVQRGAHDKRSLEFLAADLTIATNFLGEVTGQVTNEEVLGEIFSKFCIGK